MLPGRLKIRNLSFFSRILPEKLKNRIPLAWKTIYRVESSSDFENIWVFANLFWMYFYQLILENQKTCINYSFLCDFIDEIACWVAQRVVWWLA